VLAKQMVKENDFESNPDVELSVYGDGILTLPLERLVRMKLNSFRLKDRVHILDLIDVGLLNESWIPRFPQPLGERLKSLIENPDQ
jgi:hypothetical protein